MRWLDVLLRRNSPPADARSVRGHRLDTLEQEASAAKVAARHALTERRRIQLGAAVDDAARSMRGPNR